MSSLKDIRNRYEDYRNSKWALPCGVASSQLVISYKISKQGDLALAGMVALTACLYFGIFFFDAYGYTRALRVFNIINFVVAVWWLWYLTSLLSR